MASTREAPGAYDALEKALPDELIFVLLARDHAAPAAITKWAHARRMKALRDWGGDKSTAAEKELLAAELRQCAEAEKVAAAMAEWRTGHSEVQGERATYNAVAKSADEQASAARRHRREHLLRSLREAAYHLCEAKDAAADLDNEQATATFGSWELDVNSWAAAMEEQRPETMLPLESPDA